MKLLFILLIGLFQSPLWSQTSYVPPTKILMKGGYQLGLSGDYFTSTSRIDRDGEELKFRSGEFFERIQSSIFGQYGLTENLQLGLGARFRQNRSSTLNTSTEETDNETSTGLESTLVSAFFSFKPINRIHYSLEGVYRHRPFTNEENGGLILGDDGSDYLANLGVTYGFQGANFLTGKVGYRKPGIHLSHELNWQIEGALVWNKFALVAGVDGISSLKNDPYENDETERPLYNTGSTLIYNSSNREMIAPYVGFNIAIDKFWRIEVKGSEVIKAQSFDKGRSLEILILKRIDKNRISTVDKKFKDYDFEASVIKVSPKKTLVTLDKGISSDIHKGMKIDIFEFDYVGGNILIASGVVIEVKAESSIVKIINYYNTKKELKEGLMGRGSYK